MSISTKTIQALREQTGAGILDVKKALDESGGDTEKALDYLRKKGQKIAAKRGDRETNEGAVKSYIHSNGRMGSMIILSSETDFVSRNEEFQSLASDIAMHVAAADPLYIKPEDVPEEVFQKEQDIHREELLQEGKPAEIVEKILEGKMNKWLSEVTLLKQPFIKDEEKTIEDILNEAVAKMGEKIEVKKFVRFAF